MRRLLAFSLFLFTWAVALPEAAIAAVNGPVNMTVLGSSYNVYYTGIDYLGIIQNYDTTPISNSALGSTTSPNELDGISSVSPNFLQPWWGSETAAKNAALNWYNKAGTWPVNDGVQLPNNSGLQTPYFAYASVDGGNDVAYAAVDDLGAVFTSQRDIYDPSYYAVAASAVSN